MKKSTLLSLLTAGAVIATSAGTFAAWDETSKSVSGNVTIDKNVTMTVDNLAFPSNTQRTTLTTAESDVAKTAKVNFTVKDLPTAVASGYHLEYTNTVTPVTEGATANDVTVSVVDSKSSNLVANAEDKHEAEVTVTPNSTAAAGNEYTVAVTATLTPNS